LTESIEETIDQMKKQSRFRNTAVYLIDEDFSKDEYDKWYAQIAMWISETQTKTENPKEKAKQVLDAAISGRKLNGEMWAGVEDFDLASRIRQFCGWDIIAGTGRKSVTKKHTRAKAATNRSARQKNDIRFENISLTEMSAKREEYKETLYKEFPFLDNPVYDITINALSDSAVKLQTLSEDFLVSEGNALKTLLTFRDSLKKDIDDFMKLLKIHPSQLKEKIDEGDRGDVGTLIKRWEEYGEISELYEKVDSVQEAIQIIRQLEQVRVDGSPQLADWLLWHKTGCRGHKFICSCGEEYDIHGGFSKEEMYMIAEQAHKAFGFGIKPAEDVNAKKDS